MYNEPILHANQLLAGQGGGILQAMLASIVTIPVVDDDTFIIKGRSGDGTYVTETFTFVTTEAAAFEVAIGATAAEAQTNLIAAIVADSQLWSAVATTALGQFFASAYATQFMVYRKSPPSGSLNEDRIYGVQTTAAGIKVVSFSAGGYTTVFSTEASIPATDPGAKRFGFGRVACPSEGIHQAVATGACHQWDSQGSIWRTVPGDIGDFARARSTHKTAVTVAQTTAAAISTTVQAPRGIAVQSDPANTGTIYLGYSGLTLANGRGMLYPGDDAVVPCDDAAEVFAVSATAAQSLRWEVL